MSSSVHKPQRVNWLKLAKSQLTEEVVPEELDVAPRQPEFFVEAGRLNKILPPILSGRTVVQSLGNRVENTSGLRVAPRIFFAEFPQGTAMALHMFPLFLRARIG